MTPATIEMLLLGLQAGVAAYKQISLMNLDELPPELKQMLIAQRDKLTQEILRLDSLVIGE